jgi:hypothetical protein
MASEIYVSLAFFCVDQNRSLAKPLTGFALPGVPERCALRAVSIPSEEVRIEARRAGAKPVREPTGVGGNKIEARRAVNIPNGQN